MSSIKGKKREQLEEFVKQVGLIQANVIAINPTLKEWEEVLGFSLKEDQEEFDYTGTSKDGNPYTRIDVWVKKDSDEPSSPLKIVFFLEDKIRQNRDETKTQYINNIGNCSWADDEDNLQSWFTKRPYREARNGEEDLYNFLRTWLGGLDYRDEDTELQLDWKQLMKGDVSDIKEQIGGEYAVSFIALATVVTKTKENDEGEDEIVEYQSIYNRQFLPQYCMKHFRVKNYNDDMVVATVQSKELKDLKLHEKFVYNVTGEYGCKHFFKLSPVEDYNPEENLAASEEAMLSEDEDPDMSSEY
jgi:hypothetical protein